MTALDEYKLTPLSEIIPNKKSVLYHLRTNGFVTLEDCANKGTKAISMVRGVGRQLISTLRKECYKRRIQWIKSKLEWAYFEKLKEQLMKDYGLSGHEAEVVCEIRFIEFWR